MNTIRAIDLCGGAGGWACAARGLPIHITHAFGLWPEAAKTYEINHPGTRVIVGDLRDSHVWQQVMDLRGQVDLVVGGIPCEQVSIYRNGWNPATRCGADEMAGLHRLLDTILGLVRALAPRWWCIEDVVGLADHLPPLVPYREIDAADYGPQIRRRIYVGEFPVPPQHHSDAKSGARLRPGPYRVGARFDDLRTAAAAYDQKIRRWRRGATPRPAAAPVRQGSLFGPLAQWPRVVTPSSQYDGHSTAGLQADRKSPTICDFGSRRDAELAVVAPGLPGGKRQLEWQEAARLQGFPEDYLFYGSLGATWKMIGQAIQIETGWAILAAIAREAEAAEALVKANVTDSP